MSAMSIEWVRVEDRLPESGTECIVTLRATCPWEENRRYVKGAVFSLYYMDAAGREEFPVFCIPLDRAPSAAHLGRWKLSDFTQVVIAWAPMPEPFTG